MSDESSADWSNIKSVHNELFIENKKQTFDLNNLHPEAQKRLQILGLIKINENGQQEEAPDEDIDRILRKTMQNEDPNTLADKYMMKHGLYELFKTMTTKIVLNRPTDPIRFIIDDLEKQKTDETKN